MKRAFFRGLTLLLGIAAALVGAGLASAADSPRHQEQLLAQLAEMETLLRAEDVQVESVSAWSVHRHVEHLLLANEAILGMIDAGQPPETVEPRTMLGHFVLMSSFIPRGRGTAPEGTVPVGLSRAELLTLHARVEGAAQSLDPEELPDGVVGNHPVFGGFTGANWLRRMDVHDNHHLKIVADIQR